MTIASSLLGCVSEFNTNPSAQKEKPVIEPDFLSYVERFQQVTSTDVNIKITYKEQTYPTIGICYRYETNYKENNYIEIDPTHWNIMNESFREELIFHELGHCILMRDHDSLFLDNVGIPKSIMYPYSFGREYNKYKDYYLDELVNPSLNVTNYF